jgi:hypothetical protein
MWAIEVLRRSGTLLAKSKLQVWIIEGDEAVRKQLLVVLTLVILVAAGAACSTSDNANANSNANVVATETVRPGPDGSEITTTVDANGVRTETRVFHNNPRVSKVVVTTRDGRRTTTVYAPSGESKDLADNVGDALVITGNAIADGAGWTADKAEDVAGEAKDAAKEVGDKAEDVAGETKDAAKKVGEKTAAGAKKAGSAIKKAVTP